mgnify:CR=1 FL=1
MIQQPVYYPFREVIEDNGRVFVNSQLRNEGGRYTIDFDDVEKKMIAHNVKACSFAVPIILWDASGHEKSWNA